MNIERIVSRLVQAGKPAGFHCNGSRHGDDALDAGATGPFRLLLIFHEPVGAEADGRLGVDRPA